MSTAELDTYLLANWLDLDAATKQAGRIEEAIYEALADETRRWAGERGWSGVFTYETLWLAPPEWSAPGRSRPTADVSFELGYHGPGEDAFSLTTLMGLNQDVAGFDFYQSRVLARIWKPLIASPETLATLPGFTLQASTLFHPFSMDAADVRDAAAAGDYSSVARLILPVLDNLERAVPVLSRLLGPAKRSDPAS